VTPLRQPWPLLVAGTITRDDVRTPMGVNTDGLGGSATYFTLAARLFAPVSVVGTAGPDFMHAFQAAMKGTGADLRSTVTSELPTYRWFAEHDYETGTTRNERSDQGAYRGFNPVLTADQRKARIVFLGSMEPRHQMRVLEQLDSPWLVAGDTMKLYIREQPEALEPVLQRLDYLFLNASEAMALAKVDTRGKSRDPDNVEEASEQLRRRFTLRGLVIKEGPNGATLYRHGEEIHLPALPVDPPIDPTGAGDAVAAGFLGCLAEQQVETDDSVRLALAYAMVMASFTIQHFSVRGLQPITRADVEARMVSMAWLPSPTTPA
jgi:sugar/nucleoside kinase (ribokinase family)